MKATLTSRKWRSERFRTISHVIDPIFTCTEEMPVQISGGYYVHDGQHVDLDFIMDDRLVTLRMGVEAAEKFEQRLHEAIESAKTCGPTKS